MRLLDMLREEFILLNQHPANKAEALMLLTDALERGGVLRDSMEFLRGVQQRESGGLHRRGGRRRHPPRAQPGRARAGARRHDGAGGRGLPLRGRPARAPRLSSSPPPPEKGSGTHLEALSRLAALLMQDSFREELERAGTPEGFRYVIGQAEQRQEALDAPQPQRKHPRILAVTACPTGIAHTYMAAEQLSQAARRMDVSIKVETNGAAGVRDALTEEEIRACEGIIVAADVAVDVDRFRGKPVVFVPVRDAIRNPENLIRRILAGVAPNYEGGAVFGPHSAKQILHTLYRHLMNGVSHMLPFVIGGGLLIALSYLVDSLLAPGGPAESFGGNSRLAYF